MSKASRNFSSKSGYKKYLAYGHIHGSFEASPGNTPIKIQGKPHHVVHAHKKGTMKGMK